MANDDVRQGIEFDDNGPRNVPPGAIGYIEDKGIEPAFSYLDVWREEHKRAFTVAKMMDEALLVTVQKSLADAIIKGVEYRKWAKKIEPVLADAGWWGKKPLTDSLTGETKIVQLGSPSRLQLIYDQNMRTAHARARAQAQQRDADVMPYLRYRIGPSRVHREQHVAWDGLVLPVDDPFWRNAYPPNGYNCFLEGTLVDTPNGLKEIQSIKKGDMIFSGAGREKKVIGTHKKSCNGYIVRLTLENGREILCTEDHKILTLDGWVTAKAIKPGQKVLKCVRVPVKEAVRYVDNAVESGDHKPMSRLSGGSSRFKDLNPAIDLMDIYVAPVSAKSCIVYRCHPSTVNTINDNPFVFGWHGGGIGMGFWPDIIDSLPCSGHLLSDFWPSGGSRSPELLGTLGDTLARLLGFTQSVVRVIFPGSIQSFSSMRTPAVVFAPGFFDCIASVKNRYASLVEYFFHRPVSGPNLISNHMYATFFGVDSGQGLGDGAPISFFKNLDQFHHSVMHSGSYLPSVVTSVSASSYSGAVYDLSVENDASYNLQDATVHNCKCTVIGVTQFEIDEGEFTPSKSPKLVPREYVNTRTGEREMGYEGIQPGFAMNPGTLTEEEYTRIVKQHTMHLLSVF